ncbi:MAG: hypothetical protein K2I91_05550, partial [Muribaculaceae bacterium]|nr:hypothetical protein [Muribaculaceae bacterium]
CVHEYGHLLGLPDVYDVLNTGNDTPREFDVMDTGSYNLLSARPPMFSAYEKWLCNWLEFDEAVANTKYTLPSISTGKDAKAVRIRTLKPGGKPSNEYFIFESRTAEGWDTSLSQNGILIWHINYDQTLWETNRVNVNKMANIRIVRPEQDNRTFVVWPGDDNAYTYLTPETPDFKLTPYKYPNAFKAWISNISYDAETKSGSFEYNVYTEMPKMTTVLHDSPTADADTNSVTLKWDAADGATDYLLTVQYKNMLNKWVTYDEYNNYSTHGATTFTIPNISDAYWVNEFQAFVVPFKGYPSSVTSNTISFVPANLESKVEVIEADAAGIYGLDGRIEAPAGARVFNLSGIETGTENLPAGIYIVVFEGKTAKVIVK